MDTLTHTLAGLLLGECAARAIPTGRSALSLEQRRTLYLPLLAVGSNLPDSDFLYSLITGSKLDYLLHHRGHTHTIFGLLASAALLYAAASVWLRAARSPPNDADRRWLVVWVVLAPVLHVSMDSTNTYGVHPFWPFNARWWYGDSVFILEPLLWAAAMPVLGLLHTHWLRLLVGAVVAIALALLSGLMPMSIRVVVVLAVLGGIALGHFATPRRALLGGVAAWIFVTAVFLVAHRVAEQEVADWSVRTEPQVVTLDRVLTPLPSNPLCWEVILVQLQAEEYRLRRATFALAPSWLSAADCPSRDLDTAVSAPLRPVALANTEQWEWFGEFVAPRNSLAELVSKRCEAAAFVRFSRVPWARRGADAWWLGDLRYDRQLAAGFAELELRDAMTVCPRHVPPWLAPRTDLLSRSAPSATR